MGVLYCPQCQQPTLNSNVTKYAIHKEWVYVHFDRLYLKQSRLLPLLYTVIMRLIKINATIHPDTCHFTFFTN